MASPTQPWKPAQCADCGKPITFHVYLTKKTGHMTAFRAVCTDCYWKEKKK